MSEIEYTIRRFKDGEFTEAVRFTESELKRRLFEVARRYRCLLPDGDWKGPVSPWEFLINILLHGDGENQHDLPGCEDEAGPNWKGEREKGEVKSNLLVCDYCGKRFPESQFYDDRCIDCCRDLVKNDQPSPAPTRAEWEKWAYKTAGVIWNEDGADAIIDALLSMPIIPKE